jgi:hypothetical protein
MRLFRKRAPSSGDVWWWPRKLDRTMGRDLTRMNAELMPWSRTARIMMKAAERREERLRAEEELQRRLDALGDWSPPAGPRDARPRRHGEAQPPGEEPREGEE